MSFTIYWRGILTSSACSEVFSFSKEVWIQFFSIWKETEFKCKMCLFYSNLENLFFSTNYSLLQVFQWFQMFRSPNQHISTRCIFRVSKLVPALSFLTPLFDPKLYRVSLRSLHGNGFLSLSKIVDYLLRKFEPNFIASYWTMTNGIGNVLDKHKCCNNKLLHSIDQSDVFPGKTFY